MSIPASSVLDFLKIIGRLKTEKRTGWINHSLKLPESISDHMYRMSVMSFLIPKDIKVDRDRCMKIALVHDMAEALVGDITPYQGVSKEEKHKLENEAMAKIKSTLPGPIGDEIYSLWKEYEMALSEEAKIVKDFDKLEMLIQAHEYEQEQGVNLEPFFQSTKGAIKNPTILQWYDELLSKRSENRTGKSSNTTENT
eukprot:TRINITY_DN13871_c1_g1_i1.p1 TRINITY_DN13871_c1_g1~~TRINITY_DN13871_c1_g1_i1.p1  ORF type:complete len:197 (-),score=26.40 TRINITY_DN13871_c1_g1_i1:98-688(-)